MKFFRNLFALVLLVSFITTLMACDTTTVSTQNYTTAEPTLLINLTAEVDFTMVKVEQSAQITFDTNDVNGVTFTSSDETIATVDENGLVTAVAIGTVTITVTSKSNSSVKDEVNVTVIKADPSYIVIKGDNYVEQGKTIDLLAQVRPDTANPDVIWSSNDESIATIDAAGRLTGVSVGKVKIYATSKYNSSIRGEVMMSVIEPIPTIITIKGIETPVLVGDVLTLDTMIQPAYREGEVSWSVDDESIATITEEGVLTAVGEGRITVTATLISDQTSKSETFDIYGEIDSSNILDLITVEQRLNLDYYEMTAYGFSHNYEYSTYRSVSNYYFGDIDIIQKFIPVGSSNRPGKMSQLPAGITPYNDKNIYWVVVHDTANTLPGGTAEMHSNYVLTAETSWHYTVDDTKIYQHLPDDERGYHAGDGSSLVGQGNYLGGGNRNGIGIEMAVNEGSDIFRTWQRTAKLSAQLLVKYNLPVENLKFHIDYSGKICPRTLITAKLDDVFKQMVKIEYQIAKNFGDAEVTMRSLNPEYLDDSGRIIKFPTEPMEISYEVTVTKDGVTETKIFYSNIGPSTN